MSSNLSPLVSAAAPVLVVVDMQRVFGEPDSQWATPRYADAAEGVLKLLPGFEGRAVFTRFLAPERPVGIWREYYEEWPFALQPPQSRLWELTDEFADFAQHTVDATTFGKWGPELAERVGPEGRIVLAGVSTDCCVLSTALAAADAGIEVTVAADACAGVDDASHAKALDVMDLYRPLIRVSTVAEVLGGRGELGGLAGIEEGAS
jgi:nicotinamidase-related amidase